MSKKMSPNYTVELSKEDQDWLANYISELDHHQTFEYIILNNRVYYQSLQNLNLDLNNFCFLFLLSDAS